MFAQAHYPTESLKPKELDDYLARGWFRLGQSIFTCAYLQLNEIIYRTFWLRIVLDQFNNDSTLIKLLKINFRFHVTIQQASIRPENEALYEIYKSGLSFDPSESLQTILYQHPSANIYNTLEIDIYDGGKLIAVGFFDVGKSSAAGISSFYDPAYKKYSLGKFLVYQKLLYCKNHQMDYFYLGYFAPGCKAFDYKLDIAKTALEYFDICSEKWFPLSGWDYFFTSLEETNQKLIDVQQYLLNAGVESHIITYRYFQVNLFKELQGCELFDYVQFIYFLEFDPYGINPVLVYDPRKRLYHILNCYSIGIPEEMKEDKTSIAVQILKIQETIYSASRIEEIGAVMPAVLSLARKRLV